MPAGRTKPAKFGGMKKQQPARKTAKTTKAKDGAAPKKQHITTEDRHKAFAREYVAMAFNATQAAIAAGYSVRTAASQGARLLKDAKVQAYVQALTRAAVERAEVKAEDVVRRLNDMLMADPRELVEIYVASCRHCYGVGHEYHGNYKRDNEQQGKGGGGVGHFELHFVEAPAREHDPRDVEGGA